LPLQAIFWRFGYNFSLRAAKTPQGGARGALGRAAIIVKAKQYLQQAKRLDARISANMLEAERLRALATSIPSPGLSQDRVQASGAPDRIGGIVAEIVELETEISAEIDRLVGLKAEIRERIGMMADDDLKLILQKRYLNFQKWEQIAVDMGYNYRWVLKLHNKALREFEKLGH
jgi:hypothetical protein